MSEDNFVQLDLPATATPLCPVCLSDAELWKNIGDPDCNRYSVCCSYSNQEEFISTPIEECPLYFGPRKHWQSTRKEAVIEWNEYSAALLKLRESNNQPATGGTK